MITMFWPQKYLRCLDVTTLITCEREMKSLWFKWLIGDKLIHQCFMIQDRDVQIRRLCVNALND